VVIKDKQFAKPLSAALVGLALLAVTSCQSRALESVRAAAPTARITPSVTDTATPSPAPSDWPSDKQAGYNYSEQMAQKGRGNPPVPPPSLPPIPSDATQTGLINWGGDLPSGEWYGQNSWVEQTGPTTYLYVFAGGKPTDPNATEAADAGVLVRTIDTESPPPQTYNIIVPTPDPQGQLKITGVDGNALTLSLVGTTTTYTFDSNTLTFSH
jgi:hypothetical protein